MGMLPDKIFTINYKDLNADAQIRFDQFVRDCGGSCKDLSNERETEVLAEITEEDLDIVYIDEEDE